MTSRQLSSLLLLLVGLAGPALAGADRPSDDMSLNWRGGHWRHGNHDGRYGWWWVVGGIWYFYPTPIYPYPAPKAPAAPPAPPAPARPSQPMAPAG
jgi:hypothetical protein